jgi:hypothetical protein
MTEPVPNTQAAVDFLRWLRNEHVLVSFHPVTGVPTCAHFNLQDYDGQVSAFNWIARRNGVENIYWTVNPTLGPMNTKPARKDIARVEWCHVDIDPRVGESPAECRERVLKALETKLTASLVISSGSGIQAFWRHETPILINGDLDKAESVKHYNIQWERELGGDACHNIDRLMRLPGTINIPNAKKQKKGRVKALAEIVSQNDTRYPLAAFTEASESTAGATVAAKVTVTGPSAAPIAPAAPKTKISADYVVGQVADFEEKVSPTGRLIRAHGDDRAKLYEEMKGAGIDKSYSSNSEMGNAYICTLVNAGYTPEEITGDVLDPANPAGIHYRAQTNKTRAVGRSIDAAIRLNKVAAAEKRSGINWPDGWTPYMKPFNGYGNARVAFDALGIRCSFDIFRDKIFVSQQTVDEMTKDFADHFVTLIQNEIYSRHGFYPSADTIRAIIVVRARENAFDPVLDYFDGLKWDKTPRLDKWLSTYMGASSSPYVDAVGRKVLIGLVRRVRQPGCKVDSTLVLEGKQEIGKSLMCADLAGSPDLFTDQDLLAQDGQAQQEIVKGKLVVELAELSGLKRAENEKIKSYLTRTHDRGRPAYGRLSVDQPRRFTPFATTNEEEYFRDATGNRRWWPVKVAGYDREAFLRDRDQLLAEAAFYEAEGETLYLPAGVKAAARTEQEARMVEDGWVDLLAGVPGVQGKGDTEYRVLTKHLLTDTLKLPADRCNDATLKRLRVTMLKLGWQGPDTLRVNGEQGKGYRRKGPPVQLELGHE